MIRTARPADIPGIAHLLEQVLMVHHRGRPDLFKPDVRKYTDEEIAAILEDPQRPIFVFAEEGTNGNDVILGYVFCVLQEHHNDNVLTDHTTLYIDDLCVEENCRGQNIGRRLYEYTLDYARGIGCYNVTLNVWSCNAGAQKFYEALGMLPQKTGMETIL